MRTFLLQSCSTLVFVMAAANLLFAVLLLRQFARKRSLHGADRRGPVL